MSSTFEFDFIIVGGGTAGMISLTLKPFVETMIPAEHLLDRFRSRESPLHRPSRMQISGR